MTESMSLRGSLIEPKVADRRPSEDLSVKGYGVKIMEESILDSSYEGSENFCDDTPMSRQNYASNVPIGQAGQPRELLSIHELEEELGLCSKRNLGQCSQGSHVTSQQSQNVDQLKVTNEFLKCNGFLANFNKATPENNLKAPYFPLARQFDKSKPNDTTSQRNIEPNTTRQIKIRKPSVFVRASTELVKDLASRQKILSMGEDPNGIPIRMESPQNRENNPQTLYLGPGSIQFRQFQVDFEKVLDSNRIVAGLSEKDNRSSESIAQEGAYSKQ